MTDHPEPAPRGKRHFKLATREDIALFASNRFNAVALTEHICALKVSERARTTPGQSA